MPQSKQWQTDPGPRVGGGVGGGGARYGAKWHEVRVWICPYLEGFVVIRIA